MSYFLFLLDVIAALISTSLSTLSLSFLFPVILVFLSTSSLHGLFFSWAVPMKKKQNCFISSPEDWTSSTDENRGQIFQLNAHTDMKG